MEKSYDEDFYILKLKEKAQFNTAAGFVAKTLVEWLLADHSRMVFRKDALDVYYEYYTSANRDGLESLLLFAAQHDIRGYSITEITEAHSKGIKTPFDFLSVRVSKKATNIKEISKEVASTENVAKARKMLSVFQTPDEERKRTTVARIRNRLNRRKK